MEALKNKARQLLTASRANVIIGYGEGSENRTRALFVQNPEDAGLLIFDGRCTQNLAVYLTKPEVKTLGKMAIIAPPSVMRAVLQLAAESQLTDDRVLVIGVTPDGCVMDFADLQAVENYVKTLPLDPASDDPARCEIERIAAMTVNERWEYWRDRLSACFKCYACRSACPLCYCTRCTVESNQPQWIPVAAHHLGNLEWHIMRAMHLAGRCIECGECGRACPLGIPIHLITQKVAADIHSDFQWRAGTSLKGEHPLSTFKPNDHENFIK